MLPEEMIPAFKETLFSGKFNLLLGAGISKDSTSSAGGKLLSSEQLRQELCKDLGLNHTSSLARATSNLSPTQQETYITKRFSGCVAGPTAASVTQFVWSQIFTLNIDDVLEHAYENSPSPRQKKFTINFDTPYESFRHRVEVPVVHLHGYVGFPESGYVFSHQEYARVQRDLNPWMHLLSDLIKTEPFLISGTSLTEPDLEFYLRGRTGSDFDSRRAQSILIEPYPDSGTLADCKRFGLHLVVATLEDFLKWVTAKFGPCPQVGSMIVPSDSVQYKAKPDPFHEVTFFSEFELVKADTKGAEKVSAFRYGRPPDWSDVTLKRDVVLKEQLHILDEVRAWVDGSKTSKSIVSFAQAGAGKTTTLKRVALEVSQSHQHVFYLQARDGLDIDSAAAVLSCLSGHMILCVDNFAERADSIQSLLEKLGKNFPILVIAVERDYRREHVETILADEPHTNTRIGSWSVEERARLIEKYREDGLLGHQDAHKHPLEFAKEIRHDTAAEAVCRILNDFRPLRHIIASLWAAAETPTREAYLAVALANYCFPQGVRAHVLASALTGSSISELESETCPLRVSFSPDADSFVIPMNATVASQLVSLVAKEKSDRLISAFASLANATAPYVTRRTIMQQTAEARLAGRLFDADKVVKPLLQGRYMEFYEITKPAWQWNSRYWEQRALALADDDLKTAVQHARHAVSIEPHPYTMTTLANLLLRAVEDVPTLFGLSHFNEAFSLLKKAIEQESKSGRRRTKHAFHVFMKGIRNFLKSGGVLNRVQLEFARSVCDEVLKLFSSSPEMKSLAVEIGRLIGKG